LEENWKRWRVGTDTEGIELAQVFAAVSYDRAQSGVVMLHWERRIRVCRVIGADE